MCDWGFLFKTVLSKVITACGSIIQLFNLKFNWHGFFKKHKGPSAYLAICKTLSDVFGARPSLESENMLSQEY